MAKVVGKDVLLDLMDEVKRLGDTQRRHEQSLQRLETRMDVVVEHSRELGHRFEETAKQMSSLSQRMGAVTQQMNSVTQQMNSVTQQVHTLSEQFGGVAGHVIGFSGELTSLRADLTEVIGVQAEFGGGLKRLSAILLKALGTTEDRFDELEERLTRLEKKSA